jgi:PilZ domain
VESVNDRRRGRRRSIPFVRSAVLEAGGRNHIVALTDLGPDGAFLSTRITLDATLPLRLRLVLPRDGREVSIPCKVVWRSERFDGATGRPAGIAVRFLGLDASVVRRVEEFSMEGFLPSSDPIPVEHFEYRIVERPALGVEDLNRMGLDGWELAATLPSNEGVRLVFLRRL